MISSGEPLVGSTPLNRGQAAHNASTSHLGRRPRHLSISAGGTEKLNSSSTDQRGSLNPATWAGVLSTHLPPGGSFPSRSRRILLCVQHKL
jgi:hypothetical protein